MLLLAGKAKTEDEARKMLQETITSGAAYEKFKEFVKAQGGDISVIEDLELLPKAQHIIEVKADREGYITKIIADQIGISALILGAGRETKESPIDPAVGIIIKEKVGSYVKKGDVIAYLHANDLNKAKVAEQKLLEAYHIEQQKLEERPLIFGIVTKDGIKRF
jgi:pyrimidine-nucleoside phosphorylase